MLSAAEIAWLLMCDNVLSVVFASVDGDESKFSCMVLESAAGSERLCCSTLGAADRILSRTVQKESMPAISRFIRAKKHLLTRQ
jgi:hypothetical protein